MPVVAMMKLDTLALGLAVELATELPGLCCAVVACWASGYPCVTVDVVCHSTCLSYVPGYFLNNITFHIILRACFFAI